VVDYNAPPKIAAMPKGNDVDQAPIELQLKVWKDLAISKQILMRSAAEALKLDPSCSQEELQQALETTLKKNAKADAEVAAAQDNARQAIIAMEKKVMVSEKAMVVAQTTATELQTTLDNATRQMAADRAAIAKEVQRLKDQLAEKEKQLKGINTALADTPENVLKKMNVLKKQKQEEADARRQVETALNTLRTEKRQQDQLMTDVQRNAGKLIGQHRDLHGLTLKLHEQLKPLLTEGSEAPSVPELDSKLLEEIENPADPKLKKVTAEAPKRARASA
jgi:chromosome segregation ATPase